MPSAEAPPQQRRLGDRALTVGAVLAIPVMILALWRGGGVLGQRYSQWTTERHARVLVDSVIAHSEGAVIGNPRGDQVLLEFADYQCPFCKIADSTILAVVQADPRIRLLVYQFPLTQIHPLAHSAALAAVCAQQAGHFEAFHHALYRQGVPGTAPEMVRLAVGAGVTDSAGFAQCLQSRVTDARVSSEVTLGKRLSVIGTPAFFTASGKSVEVGYLIQLLSDAARK